MPMRGCTSTSCIARSSCSWALRWRSLPACRSASRWAGAGATPLIFTGLRLSLQACCTTLVAGELIGATDGLGHVLQQSALDLFPAMILVGMLFVALAGAVMTWALGLIEQRAMPWRS